MAATCLERVLSSDASDQCSALFLEGRDRRASTIVDEFDLPRAL